jgi:prevent-host-death family protein
MSEREIAQRELRNDVARVLREAEAGATFTITVRGRPVARLGPLREARVDVDRETLNRIMAEPLDSEDLAEDLAAAERPMDAET